MIQVYKILNGIDKVDKDLLFTMSNNKTRGQFPEQCLTSFLNDLLFAHLTVLPIRGRFDLHPFFGTCKLLPLPLYGSNQDRCEGVLSVVLANIVAINCTSIHFLLKQRLN